MAGVRALQCVGPSYPLPDRKAACMRAVNLALKEVEGLGEDKQLRLVSSPGLDRVHDFDVETRGHYTTETRRFVVAGAVLYEISSNDNPIYRGGLDSSTGRVSMKHGRDQLVVVDGVSGYVLSLRNERFQRITDEDWRGSYTVDEINGTFIFADPGTDQFYLAEIDDATNLNALDFSSADANPDRIVTFRVHKQLLYLFGTLSIEPWAYNGAADFPLERYTPAPIDIGIVGRNAVTAAADSLIFCGQTKRGAGIVYQLDGGQVARISNEAVEKAIARATSLPDMVLTAYQTAGAEYVQVKAPGMETAWCWDAKTREWHERADIDENGDWEPIRIDEIASIGSEHYAIGGTKLYRLDEEVYSNDGDPLVRARMWPHLIHPSMEEVSYDSLELACTTGHGGQVALRISNNGGFTFGPPLLKSLGAVGRWMERIRWQELGSARDRVFELRVSDAVPFSVHAANLEVS